MRGLISSISIADKTKTKQSTPATALAKKVDERESGEEFPFRFTMEDQDDKFVLASDPNSPDHQCLRQLAKRNRPNTPESEHRTLNDSIAKTKSLLEGLAQLSKLCDSLAKNIDSRKLTKRIGILNRRETWEGLREDKSIKT